MLLYDARAGHILDQMLNCKTLILQYPRIRMIDRRTVGTANACTVELNLAPRVWPGARRMLKTLITKTKPYGYSADIRRLRAYM